MFMHWLVLKHKYVIITDHVKRNCGFRIFIHINLIMIYINYWLAAGVSGRHGMLTLPRYLIPTLECSVVRVSPILNLYFFQEIWYWPIYLPLHFRTETWRYLSILYWFQKRWLCQENRLISDSQNQILLWQIVIAKFVYRFDLLIDY